MASLTMKPQAAPWPLRRALTGIEPTPAPKIFTETCRIDWSRYSARRIHNLVRGFVAVSCRMDRNQKCPTGVSQPLKVFPYEGSSMAKMRQKAHSQPYAATAP